MVGRNLSDSQCLEGTCGHVMGEGHGYGGQLGITYRTNYSVAVRLY